MIRTDTLEELFDVAALLSTQPVPAGPRVGVVTNAGGPGILLADACEAHGLTLPELAPATLATLRAFLPRARRPGQPDRHDRVGDRRAVRARHRGGRRRSRASMRVVGDLHPAAGDRGRRRSRRAIARGAGARAGGRSRC